jgi:hypothetical protein
MRCRTPDEAFQAGCDDAKSAPPLSQGQADHVAAILLAAHGGAAAGGRRPA